MRTEPTVPKAIDEYIAGFPDDVQKILKKILIPTVYSLHYCG